MEKDWLVKIRDLVEVKTPAGIKNFEVKDVIHLGFNNPS